LVGVAAAPDYLAPKLRTRLPEPFSLLDLEPAFRDAVVLALPMSPLCREDCPGLCAECGVPLADAGPGHRHDETVAPRWAALKHLDDQATDQMDRRAGAIDLQEG
jgi:hypothetical protein